MHRAQVWQLRPDGRHVLDVRVLVVPIWEPNFHYYTNEYAQRCTFALRGGHLFLPAAVNPTIYHGGHFLFTAAVTFARHGKSIYRGGHLNMSATVNTLFTVADIVRCPPR